jgi:hypothetical protein
MTTPHRKGQAPSGQKRNSLNTKDRHTLNQWIAAHAGDLDGLTEADIVARCTAGTGLVLTWANVTTAQEATGAVFAPKPRRPVKPIAPELPLVTVLPSDTEAHRAAVLAELRDTNTLLRELLEEFRHCWRHGNAG